MASHATRSTALSKSPALCVGSDASMKSALTYQQERNSLGAVKAVTAAQLSMAADGVYSVTLDEGLCISSLSVSKRRFDTSAIAIAAMKLTAQDMSVKYKETSLSGLAVSTLPMMNAWPLD